MMVFRAPMLQVTGWQPSGSAEGHLMATRKLLFTGSTVVLAGDTNVDELLLAFAEQPVIFEVGTITQTMLVMFIKHPSCPLHAYSADNAQQIVLLQETAQRNALIIQGPSASRSGLTGCLGFCMDIRFTCQSHNWALPYVANRMPVTALGEFGKLLGGS